MGKNHSMSRVERSQREKVTRYSVRKVSFGAASVAVAAFFMFLGNGAVYAAEPNVTATGSALAATPANNQLDENSGASDSTVPKAQAGTTTPTPVDASSTSVESAPASKVQDETPAPTPVAESASVTPAPASATEKAEEKATSDLDKKQLEDYVAEIDAKLASGSYATKTDESVATLKEHLELAKLALTTATSQDELTKAYRRLFMTASSGLRSKPKAQVESPKLDTTEGKATVGKKANNTEKAADTNSIANSGSRDERSGKALDKNNPFRTGTTPSTTDDTSATQVFDNPVEGADVKTLSNKLESLPETIQNNEKIQNMDELGNAKNVAKGQVLEIDEFGGWNAVGADGKPGKFAIARKTDKGVFPIETVNTVWNSGRKIYQTWVLEQSFDRTSDYMLFLSKVRTKADKEEETFDGSKYVHTGEPGNIARGVKGFNGIQKTFKAYSKEHGSKVVVSFKTGYTGDIEGTKAQYKVEVIINRNGKEEKLYDQTFKPQEAQQNDEMTVVKASDGKNSPQFITTPDTPSPTKEDLDAKIANNKPNGTGGTFTSKEIEIPKGVTEYTVRISSADNQHLGMGYQSVHRHYALPLTGSDFSIKQDTKNVAKDLLQRIYNRLVEQKSEDTKWSTPETKGAYETKLTEIDNLLNSGINTTSNYKESAKSLIEKYNSLNNREEIVAAAKAAVAAALAAKEKAIEGNSKLSEAEKTAAKAEAKKAADDATKAIEAANDQDGVDAQETAGTGAVAAVNPVGKDNAKAAVAAALAAKEKAIEGNSKLSEAEKTAAKAEAKKAADDATKAIEAANDQDGVDAQETAGTGAVAAVNPVGKDNAKAAVAAALAAKEKAIEGNSKLSEAEKTAAKAQVVAEAKKAIEAIEKATTEADVEAAKEAGKAEIAKVAPATTDYKAKAKAEVEAELAKKLAELENATDLTEAEKAAAKAQVVNKAKEAIEAIQKAATEADVDQAIRNFVYRISAVIREQEEYDLSKLFVNGSVIVKQGESLTDKDILAKLSLPNGVEIVKVEKPTTSALGRLVAKVTLKLSDGSVEEINVPVEVVAPQNHGNEGNGANNGANNTEAKVNKAKLEGAIHQLDELLLKESAKFDAETAKEANALSADAKKVFANADASQAEVDAMVKRIEDFMAKVASSTDHATPANDQAAQTPAVAPATTQAAANAGQTASAQANARKAAKELPNTGTADSTVAMVAAAASALLGLGLAGRRRKEDEEA